MIGTSEDVLNSLVASGLEVLPGKGGFWIRGEGHITLAQARKRTGIKAIPRIVQPQVACGDYGMLCAMFAARKR